MNEPELLQVEEADDIVIARPLKDNLLDPASVQQLRLELTAIVAERRPPKLLVSLANITRCSTGVINSLLLAKKRMLMDGGEIRICALSDSIRHTFRILNLEGTVFDVFETEDEALMEF